MLNPFRYRGYYLDAETGLYYLMSRYYDPVTHRFLNADGYFQSGSSILDTNMTAYCANNPVNHSDEIGQWYIKDGIKTIVRRVTQHVKSIQDELSSKDITLSRGRQLSVGYVSLGKGYSVDTKGNIVQQTTISVSPSAAVSFTNYFFETNAHDVKRLRDFSLQGGIGANFEVESIPITCSIEGVCFNDNTKRNGLGQGLVAQTGLGISLSPDSLLGFKGGLNFTWDSSPSINIFDIYDQFATVIERW